MHHKTRNGKEYRLQNEEDNYRYVLEQVFKDDKEKFNRWLEQGEPRDEEGRPYLKKED